VKESIVNRVLKLAEIAKSRIEIAKEEVEQGDYPLARIDFKHAIRILDLAIDVLREEVEKE